MLRPYSIDEKNGVATFTAANQAIYKAFFLQVSFTGEPQLEGFIVDFTFVRDTTNCVNTKSRAKDGTLKKYLGRNDARIQVTLEHIVGSFFDNNPHYVVYFTCESIDNKHNGRLQMFDAWYAAHQEHFTKVPFRITGGFLDSGEDLPATVGGAIFLKSHPLHELIVNFVNSEVLVYNAIKS